MWSDASIDHNSFTFFVEFNSFCNNCIDVFDTVNCKSYSTLSFSDFRIVSIREVTTKQVFVCVFVFVLDEGIFTIWEDNVDNWKVVLNVCDNVWVAHVECTVTHDVPYLAIWIVFLSSDTTRKGNTHCRKEWRCTPHVLRCHVKVTSRCLSSVTYVDWIDSVLISMFVDCIVNLIQLQFTLSFTFEFVHVITPVLVILNVCTPPWSRFNWIHFVKDCFRCLTCVTKDWSVKGVTFTKFVRVNINLDEFFSVLECFINFSKWEVWTKEKNCVCFKDHFVGWLPTNTVSRTCQTFIVPFKGFKVFTSCDDWCFDFTWQFSNHFTSFNTTVTSIDNWTFSIVQDFNSFVDFNFVQSRSDEWTFVWTWTVVWIFVDFLETEVYWDFNNSWTFFRNCSTASFVDYFWQLLSVSYTFVVYSDTVVHWVLVQFLESIHVEFVNWTWSKDC